MVYLPDAVYDNEGIWTSTPMPDTELERHCYTVDNVEICDALEVKIPRSYAQGLGWTYDASSKGGMQDRNTGWGTVHYGDITAKDWLPSPGPSIHPAPYAWGYSGNYLVLVFDELGKIAPGATNELSIHVQLAENVVGTYTIKALIVWEGTIQEGQLTSDQVSAIVSAAG